MTLKIFSIIFGTLAFASALVYAQDAHQEQHAKTPKIAPSTTSSGVTSYTDDKDGERIFQQQCARCHSAPEGFSPRISGTVVRHMRVRASLSKEDEQKLLRFFNP